MSRVGSRKGLASVSLRDFTTLGGRRDFLELTGKRVFLTDVTKREFGMAVIGWRLWGQTDIHPFDYPTGVDSTKTYGDLP